ncbi:DUF1572 domain-containing protein [Paenibacillus sp. H1-7]|uniref:DinB family protein n=1 Tax=Paenibacillus sp. H1-7 TaxID=2282849 RepID=UPI001EF82532|nr:DUF1572 family protein [Paenibacillus sp. H1-7]ULL16161.1 DUF1572 domain-containing protein [Paenibacillus sp. H1-7]
MKLNTVVLNELNKQLSRIEACINLLSEAQIWYKIKPTMNSIGNLCLHLAGNEYQHFVSGIGNLPFQRTRSREFLENNGMNGRDLLQLLHDVRRQSSGILEGLKETDLQKSVTIYYSIEDWNKMLVRSTLETEAHYSKDIETMLVQVCEHYSYHTGQIVLLTKWISESQNSITGTFH